MPRRDESRTGNGVSVVISKQKRIRGEPPAPTPLDEVLSVQSLETAPWVRQRIKELGIKGRRVTTWSPPILRTRPDGDVAVWQ